MNIIYVFSFANDKNRVREQYSQTQLWTINTILYVY